MNAERSSNHSGIAVSEPIAARTRRRLQLERRTEISNPVSNLMRNELEIVSIDEPVAARTRAHIPNESNSENQNNLSTPIVSNELIVEIIEPIASRTRARLNHSHLQQSASTSIMEDRREVAPQEQPNVEGRRRTSVRNNQSRNRSNRQQNTRGRRAAERNIERNLQASFSRGFPHGIFEYFHEFPIDEYSPFFPIFTGNSSPLSELTLRSTDNSITNNSTSLMPSLDLSTTEISDPLNAFKCAICLDLYVKKEPVVTKCGHIYCRLCINQWLYIGDSCPKCNTTVDAASLMRVFP